MKAVLLVLMLALTAQAECRFTSAPKSNGRLLVWEEPNRPSLFSIPENLPELVQELRRRVSAKVSPLQNDLLKRQKRLFVDAFGAKAGRAYDQLLEGKIGSIVPARCLELLLLEHQLEDQTSVLAETEFRAAILAKEDRLKIILLTGESIGAPSLKPLTNAIKEDIERGWSFAADLHNHPFIFSNFPNDYAGTLIPSGTVSFGQDLEVFAQNLAEFDLKAAWITNGFDTLLLPAADFGRFE